MFACYVLIHVVESFLNTWSGFLSDRRGAVPGVFSMHVSHQQAFAPLNRRGVIEVTYTVHTVWTVSSQPSCSDLQIFSWFSVLALPICNLILPKYKDFCMFLKSHIFSAITTLLNLQDRSMGAVWAQLKSQWLKKNNPISQWSVYSNV